MPELYTFESSISAYMPTSVVIILLHICLHISFMNTDVSISSILNFDNSSAGSLLTEGLLDGGTEPGPAEIMVNKTVSGPTALMWRTLIIDK